MENMFGSPRRREASGDNISIECQDDVSVGGLRLYISGGTVKPFVAEEIQFKEAGLYDFLPTALIINRTEAQGLLESLWKAGIRPRSGEGSVGQLDATERHLSDMRALVSHYAKAELK